MRMIKPSELLALRESGIEYALFDIRESAEANAGHIFGATFLPRRLVMRRIRALVPRWDTPVVIYGEGDDDKRGIRAANALSRFGYSSLHVLAGGWQAWQVHGKYACQGSNVPSKWFGETVEAHCDVPSMPATALYEALARGSGYRICDIRSPEEFQRSRIPGAVGVFGTDVALAAADLLEEDRPVVVHCSGRTRSIIACQSLRLLGLSNVHALENGTMGWRLHDYDLEKGSELQAFQPTPKSRVQGRERAMELARKAGADRISADELARYLHDRKNGRLNMYLFDVRQLSEYIAGHVPDAIALPGGLAIQRTDEFIPVRAAQVVLVDDDEARASLAAYWLRAMGLPRVAILEGGISSWTKAGLPLHTGRTRDAPLDAEEAGAVIKKVSPQKICSAPEQYRLLYVDTQARFLKGRPAGAEWAPFGNLEDVLHQHANSTDGRSAVLVADSESLSMSAAWNAYLEGARNIRALEGGVNEWRAQGYPWETGPARTVPYASDVVIQPYDAGLDAMRNYLSWEQNLTGQPFPSLPLYTDYEQFAGSTA